MRCTLDKKSHDYHVPTSDAYPGGDPEPMVLKRVLFWTHMLLVPAACVWAVLVFENQDSIAYNIFYLLYVIGFFLLLLVSAWYDSKFRSERKLSDYKIAKRLSRVLLIAYPVLWLATFVSPLVNLRTN